MTASASQQLAASLASSGKGSQTFEGGGLTYGTVGKGTTILVVNLSLVPTDLSVTIKDKPIKYLGGKLYTARDPKGLAFKVSGADYRLVIKGSSRLNGINVWGTADFKPAFPGSGSYSLNGGPSIPWTRHQVSLGDPPPPAGTSTP